MKFEKGDIAVFGPDLEKDEPPLWVCSECKPGTNVKYYWDFRRYDTDGKYIIISNYTEHKWLNVSKTDSLLTKFAERMV